MKILKNVDVLVDGQFKDDLKNFKMRFRGSENQRIIDVQETLNNDRIILRDDLMKLRV